MNARRPVSPTLLLVVTLAVGFAAARPCAAQDGDDATREWSRYQGWDVSAFAVEGLPPALEAEVVGGLAGRGRWRLLGGFRRPPFSEGTLRKDLRRIRLHLARHGYPAARVRVRLEPDPEAVRLAVRLGVEPGPPVRVAEVALTGWPMDVPRPAADEEWVVRVGDVFADAAVEEMEIRLRSWLRDAGYALAAVEVSPRLESATAVTLDFGIDAGDPYRITRVEVTGCAEDLRSLARRVLDVPVGSEFSARRLDEAASDLRGTQLFSGVELRTEPAAPGELALTAELSDARWRSWRASVGTWSDNPFMLRGGWTHRNLFRGGRGLDVSGTYATHLNQQRLGYFWLGWLAPRARTTLASERQREDEDAYTSREYRLEAVQAFRPRNRAMMNVGVGLSNVEIETTSPDATDLPESQDWLLEVWLDRKWDWTDDAMYPTQGGYFKASLTYAPPGGPFKVGYAKLQGDAAGYLPWGDAVVLAGRVRGGWSRPLGGNPDVIANRRFYSGGYNTMRGYGRRKLGPRDAAGNPRGGQATVLAGTELRAPVVGIFSLAAFLDAGQVWREPSEMRLGDVVAAVGAAVDVRTPLGPLRVGWAWNLTPPPAGDDRGLWHFGIGYPW